MNRLTPEDPQKAAQRAKLAGEIALGLTPAGIAIDFKDMAKAIETKDPVLATMAGIGFLPFLGDTAKGIFKSLDELEVDKAKKLLKDTGEAQRLWREKGTDSPFFQRWFGRSQVVTSTGQPRVMYHGTATPFEEPVFRVGELPEGGSRYSEGTGEQWRSSGAYFTPDLEAAEEYASLNAPWSETEGMTPQQFAEWFYDQPVKPEEPRGHIYRVYLSVKNPFYEGVTTPPAGMFDEYVDAVQGRRKELGMPPADADMIERARSDWEVGKQDHWKSGPDPLWGDRSTQQHLIYNNPMKEEGPKIRRSVLQKYGFDGEVWRNSEYGEEFIVFEPEQIKSLENTGAFDPSDPNMHSSVIAPAAIAGSGLA